MTRSSVEKPRRGVIVEEVRISTLLVCGTGTMQCGRQRSCVSSASLQLNFQIALSASSENSLASRVRVAAAFEPWKPSGTLPYSSLFGGILVRG